MRNKSIIDYNEEPIVTCNISNIENNAIVEFKNQSQAYELIALKSDILMNNNITFLSYNETSNNNINIINVRLLIYVFTILKI